MTTREIGNVSKMKEKAAAAGKRIVKEYRAIEGDLRVILEDSSGAQERWTVSGKEPQQM